MLRRTEFILKELRDNLIRNGLLTIAAFVTVVSSLTILGLFQLSNANIQHLLVAEARKAQISAFLPSNLKSDDVQRLQQRIAEVPGVLDVHYVSSREAYEQFKKDISSELLNDLGDEGADKLPAKFSITPVSSDRSDAIAAQVGKMAGVAEVSYASTVVKALNDLLRSMRVVGWLAAALLLLATCANIGSAIRLTIYARRREIRIMQLVGATDWFVRAPFLLEGLFHGVVGAFAAALLTFLIYAQMAPAAEHLMPFLQLLDPADLRWRYAGAMLGVGAVVGVVSALYSLRRFLQQN